MPPGSPAGLHGRRDDVGVGHAPGRRRTRRPCRRAGSSSSSRNTIQSASRGEARGARLRADGLDLDRPVRRRQPRRSGCAVPADPDQRDPPGGRDGLRPRRRHRGHELEPRLERVCRVVRGSRGREAVRLGQRARQRRCQVRGRGRAQHPFAVLLARRAPGCRPSGGDERDPVLDALRDRVRRVVEERGHDRQRARDTELLQRAPRG